MSKKYHRKVEEAAEGPLTCGICGTVSPVGTIICESCGGSLGDETELANEPDLEDGELPREEEVEAEPELQYSEPDPVTYDEVEAASEELEDGDKEVAGEETSPLQIKKTMLFVGIGLSMFGIFGVVGLRTGIVQLALGDSNSFPGIGSVEPMGHIVSMVPLVIGIVLIGLWGIRNDPIYNEIEKMKEEDSSIIPDEEEDEEIPEEFIDAVEDEKLESDEIEEEALSEAGSEITTSALKHDIAEQLRVDRCEKMLTAAVVLPGDKEKLRVLIQGGISTHEFMEKIKGATDRWKKVNEKAIPEIEVATIIENDLIAELADLERCEKMLGAIVVLPDDKQKLRLLITSGISAEEFVKEVKKAVERRKKRELEKDITADEKASILEDELVSELEELEDELVDDAEDKKLEDQILKEIEELENL
jgi:hypothetical protein